MPLIDMPLEELRTYQGRNPRPADFDEYWDQALAEMKRIERGGGVGSARDDRAVRGGVRSVLHRRGRRAGARQVPAPEGGGGAAPGGADVPRLSGSSGEWSDKLNYVAQGYSVAALDCRGQGGHSEDIGGQCGNTLRGHIIRGLDDEPEKLLFRQIFLDYRAAGRDRDGHAGGGRRPRGRDRRIAGRRADAGLRLAGAAHQAARRRSSRSCAITCGCGRWTWRWARTRN